MVDTQADVEQVLEAAAPKLRRTLERLTGSPWATVVMAFGLQPYDQSRALKILGLAEDGPVEDSTSGVRPVVPTEFAKEVINSLQAPLTTSTLEDFRSRIRSIRVASSTDCEVKPRDGRHRRC
jgi:hypothetical protein